MNIASRAATFLTKHFDGRLSATPADDGSVEQRAGSAIVAWASRSAIAEAYEAREFGKALREAMRIADRVNERFDAGEAVGARQGSGAGATSCTTSARTR